MATVRCEEIANEKYSSFAGNEVFSFHICLFHIFISSSRKYVYIIAKLGSLLPSIFPQNWQELEEAVQSAPVPGFGKKISSILYTCLSE